MDQSTDQWGCVSEPIVRNGRPPTSHSMQSFLQQYTGSFKKPPLRRPHSVIGGSLGSFMAMPRNGSRLGESHTQTHTHTGRHTHTHTGRHTHTHTGRQDYQSLCVSWAQLDLICLLALTYDHTDGLIPCLYNH